MNKSLGLGDIFLILFLLVFSVYSYTYITKFFILVENLQLKIFSEKKEETFPLLKDFEILRNGVRIVVQGRKVFVLESTCQNKNCVKMGKISKAGQFIICAPNKVVIKIVSQNLPIDTLGF